MIGLFPVQVRAWEKCIHLDFITPLIFCSSSVCFYVSATDQSSSCNGEMKSDIVPPVIREDEDTQKAVQADLSFSVSTERSTESTDPQLSAQPGESTASTEQPPSSPMMDLETDFPPGEKSYHVISTPSLLKSGKLADWRWRKHTQVSLTGFLCVFLQNRWVGCRLLHSEE